MIPGSERPGLTYLDHNAISPIREECRALLATLRCEVLGHPSGLHQASHRSRRTLQDAAQQMARVVGARAADLTWTSGGTEANRLVVEHLPRGRVLVGATEHDAVLKPVRAAEQRGWFEVDIVPVDASGRHDLDALRAKLPGAQAVFLMAANHETGVLSDLDGIAARIEGTGVWWHCDAVQALGRVPMDLSAGPWSEASSVALASHKVGGPPGMGALVVRDGALERGGTVDVAAVAAFALAATSCTGDRYDPSARGEVEAQLLRRFPGGRIHGANAPRLPNTVYVSCIDGSGPHAADELVEELALRGVCVGTGAACASRSRTPSSVLTAMGVGAEEASSSMRVSWGPGGPDLEPFLDALDRVLASS